MKINKRYKKNNKERNMWFIIISIFFVIGIFCGIIMGIFTSEIKTEMLTKILKEFFVNYNISENGLSSNFIEVFLKHGKLIALIWISGFVSFGKYISLTLVFTKGLAFGFSTYFLIKIFENNKFLSIMSIYSCQNILILTWILILTYNSIKFAKKISKNKKDKDNNLPIEYIALLIMSLAIISLSSMIEIYIMPKLITDYIVGFL